ncbi:hypothetical protein M3Y98_00905600 [Aphelenchoides besseyi]|nr:hypothetical protein M3Y98_00905600 [Aphelenchoides besseyi]
MFVTTKELPEVYDHVLLFELKMIVPYTCTLKANCCVFANWKPLIFGLITKPSKLFPENAATRRFTHTIFQALQQHYELNFEETPIRIGQIVSLIDQIGSLSFSLNELVIMWKLNGIDSIFRLPAQISPQFTLASGPVSSLYTPPSSCTSLSDDLCSV